MPFVSVVMPVFNSERFLPDAMNSVLNQTFRDFEIIAIDDGSTDRSGMILDEFAHHDRRIIAVHTTNRGVSSARNLGMESSHGEFLVFLDSDDTLDTDALATLRAAQRESNADYIRFGYRKVKDTIVTNVDPVPQPRVYSSRKDRTSILLLMANEIEPGFVCTSLFRRKNVGDLRFDEILSFREDLVFTLQYLKHCSLVQVIGDRLYNYRQHEGSISNDFRNSQKASSTAASFVASGARIVEELQGCQDLSHDDLAKVKTRQVIVSIKQLMSLVIFSRVGVEEFESVVNCDFFVAEIATITNGIRRRPRVSLLLAITRYPRFAWRVLSIARMPLLFLWHLKRTATREKML